MKSFLNITDFSSDELQCILDRADYLHKCWHNNQMPQSLAKQRIALWFWGSGFRNRMAFEIGARAMGADISYVPGELGVHEPLEDMGYYLKNWFTMLVIRAKKHEDLLEITKQADIPVINARTNFNHPCEIIGDLQFIRRKRKSLDGLNVVFVGELTNMCMSWFEAAVRLPITVTQVAPKGFQLDPSRLSELKKQAVGKIFVTDNMEDNINKNTDLIYTDCWPRNQENEKIRELFYPYQITSDVLKKLNENAIFLPCPPVTRGEEVSEDAMKSSYCMNYEAKEFLLHSQNAIMEHLATAYNFFTR